MKCRIETYRIFLTAETEEERDALHELAVRKDIRSMHLHDYKKLETCMELHTVGGPATPPEEPVQDPRQLLAEFRRCIDRILRTAR